MKTLIIVRHAKSDREDGELHDIERPLASRGYADAKMMGALLLEKGVRPDMMISSPAVRAFSTSIIMADILNFDKNNIKIETSLYEGNMPAILALIENAKAGVMMLFGHNPTFTILANTLCPEFGTEMPTCGVVAMNEKINEKKQSVYQVQWFEYPKKIR